MSEQAQRIADIKQRWGTTRSDFDWSLHGNAVRGEQAVKDIRWLLSVIDAQAQALAAAEENARRLIELEAGYRASEQAMLRRLSDILTGGNAGDWEQICHAAALASQPSAEER